MKHFKLLVFLLYIKFNIIYYDCCCLVTIDGVVCNDNCLQKNKNEHQFIGKLSWLHCHFTKLIPMMKKQKCSNHWIMAKVWCDYISFLPDRLLVRQRTFKSVWPRWPISEEASVTTTARLQCLSAEHHLHCGDNAYRIRPEKRIKLSSP